MPKITEGRTSDDRKQAIREVLNLYGKLGREELFEFVANKLQVDKKSIRSSLYKDLTTLTDKGVIEKQFLHLDDTPMSESETTSIVLDEDDGAKSYKLLWSLKGYENSITGSKLLDDLGGAFYLPSMPMQRDYAFMDATKTTHLGSFSIIFEIGDKILKLALDEKARPATIVVGRSPSQDFVFPREQFIEEFGKRAALLLLPNRLLSSCKPGGRLGHFSITFKTASEITLRDLGSKNRLRVMRLSKDDLAIIDLRLGSYPGQTTTIPLIEATYSEAESRTVTNEPMDESLPTMAYITGGFGFILR